MITISLSPEAFAAIAQTLCRPSEAKLRPDGNGRYWATLPNGVLDRLEEHRRPGESYTQVILRLEKGAL